MKLNVRVPERDMPKIAFLKYFYNYCSCEDMIMISKVPDFVAELKLTAKALF